MHYDFWLAQEFLPHGLGFGLHSASHRIWLTILAGLILGICLAYQGMGFLERKVTRMVLGFGLPFAELFRNLILASQGVFRPFYWPFQLCGLAMFVFLAYALRPNRFCGEVLYSLCLPGTLCALLFPDWAENLPIFQFQSVYSFLYHGILAGCILMLLTSGEFKPSPGGIAYSLLFLAAVVPPLYLLNEWLGTNFFFLHAPAKGSPLETIAALAGPNYLLFYLALALCILCLFYLPVWVAYGLKRHRRAVQKAIHEA